MKTLLTKRLTLLALLLSFSFTSYAQFTYIGGGVSYNRIPINKGSYLTNTALSTGNIEIGAMYRPVQHFGVGINISIPVTQKSKFDFRDAPTWSSSPFSDFSSDYRPQIFNYSFQQSPTTSFHARMFLETNLNSYFDFNMSITNIEESFQLKRAYQPETYFSYSGDIDRPAIEAIDAEYNRAHGLIIPGFTLGIMPQFENFYLDLNVGLDFVQFGRSGFSYDVSFEENYSYDTNEYVTLTSQATGNKIIWSSKLGFGYYF